MASSNVSLKAFNILFPFGDFLYILQQEDYSSRRYLKWLPRFFLRRNIQARDRLRYTARAGAVLAIALALWLASLAGVFFNQHAWFAWTAAAIVWLLAVPLFVLAANIVFIPFYLPVRYARIRRAAEKVRAVNGLRIVTIAGSFGKTTTKNFLYELVRHHAAVQMIAGNVNTPLGIAGWIMEHLRPDTEILIAEVDAYRAGEIRESCRIVPPDVAILTSIGHQHMERFGSVPRLAAALGEVFIYAKPRAKLLAPPDVARMVDPLLGGRQTIMVGEEDVADTGAHLSASARSDLALAARAAELLGAPERFINDAAQKLTLPDRRQKATVWHGYDCIDDSYNISFPTAQAGIAAAESLARKKGKKLLAVTAGIPELGPADKNGNERLGMLLAGKADHIVVLKSIFVRDIVRGIPDKEKYTVVANLTACIEMAPKRFPPERWALLLEPELTDLYY
ncbi:MAG: Mur ligase family protein [Minisyncoccia bacterium]|jgi:UDP-N-acetylmuramoyl-tripeptide--D-alanyl-D-alanine ligase